MSKLINTVTGEYPVTIQAFLEAHANTSFAYPINYVDYGHAEVQTSPRPVVTELEKYEEVAPTLDPVTGVYSEAFTIVPKFATLAEEEAHLAQLRQQKIDQLTVMVQGTLDTFAQTKGYDSIFTACTYATSNNLTRKAEGQRCVDLRDQTWDAMYLLLNNVTAGTTPEPQTFADVVPHLPLLAW